ncbi:MAG: hypothetical protein HC897_07675 [Thermoanaerobaculia bacterium]|nr:hypothetical protein [Thermoanaerobaculia bacterium]
MKRTTTRLLLAGAAIFAGLALASGVVATEKLAEQEGLVCTSCHDKPGSKLLTDRGKYFELMGSLEGFEKVKETFGRCTYCHSSKPGSKKLTKAGRAFEFAVGDMEGLKKWLAAEHPGLPEATEENDAAQDKK